MAHIAYARRAHIYLKKRWRTNPVGFAQFIYTYVHVCAPEHQDINENNIYIYL